MRPSLRILFALAVLLTAGCTAGLPPAPDTMTPAATPAHAGAGQAVAAVPVVRLVIEEISHEALRPRVEKLLSNNPLQAILLLDDDPSRPAGHTVRLSFEYRELPLTDIENIWTATDALLLTLYPATCNRYRFSLRATVQDATGQTYRTYSLQDVDTAWVWLLLGPKCGSPEGLAGDGVGDAAEQLLKELYRRMASDRVLEPGRVAELRAGQGPLIHVTSNRAAALIEEAFLLDDAPVRFTFDPAEAAAADYHLQLHLSFAGREYSAGRAWLALMTAGLSGVCPTHSATLEGSMVDREGRLLSHYTTDAHWQPTMADSCALEDEFSNPERVRRLARELKAQVSLHAPDTGRAALSRSDAPLVWIGTNAVRPIVERVANERRPFRSVTLVESARDTADYRLDLEFTSSGEGPRINATDSVAKQVAVGAMIGLTFGSTTLLCRPISYELAATLQDAAGTTVARYGVAKTATASEPGCGAPSEPPAKVAEALLEQLCTQMARDPSLPAALRGRQARGR